MYAFRDTIKAEGSVMLPSEAMKINGDYIESLIPGYRTISVTGREALSPEVDSYTTGIRDGTTKKSKRYPERRLRIKYQIRAGTNEEFREAFNKLARILDVEDAELIFYDEQDKFFTGTPSAIEEVEPGKNIVVGEFEILCTDPFKYSVIEYEAVPLEGENSVLIEYAGTYRSFPVLQAEFYKEEDTSENGETSLPLTGNGDCGYVAFFNEDAKIVQLGDPDEADGEDAFEKSQTLVNSSFKKNTSWGSAAKKQWKVNSGITSSDTVVQTGSVGMAAAQYQSSGGGGSTSGTLLNATSKASTPVIHYSLTAKTSGRTASSVKVVISIKTWLDKDSNYFGTGFGLKGHVYIGGAWREVTIKSTSAYWQGKTGHTVNLTATVSGLTSTAESITGIKFKVTRIDGNGSAGKLNETACSALKIRRYASASVASYYLAPTSYGSGSRWHGPSITRVLPADASGEVGAVNCQLSYVHKMSIGSGKGDSSQLGAMQVLLVTGSGSGRKIVAGANVFKSVSGKRAKLRFYLNGKTVQTLEVDLSYGNKHFAGSRTSTITKSGDTVVFQVGGVKRTFKDAAIKELPVNEITFTFMQSSIRPKLSFNGLCSVKFVKNNCETWQEVPNKFGANDVVEADCKNGEIWLNGASAPFLGALGNDWEDFCLMPGFNSVGFAWSDWVKAGYEPKFKVRYREVFL